MSDPFLGEIRVFGFNFPPIGWAFCTGQVVSIQQYSALFSLLGTSFGGNGTTNFGLPNFQGIAPMGSGSGSGLSQRFVGETAGSETVTLTTAQLPGHMHSVQTANTTVAAQRTGVPGSTVLPGTSLPAAAYIDTGTPNAGFAPAMIGPAGGSQPHPNGQPLLTLNFCIALSGVFPQRP